MRIEDVIDCQQEMSHRHDDKNIDPEAENKNRYRPGIYYQTGNGRDIIKRAALSLCGKNTPKNEEAKDKEDGCPGEILFPGQLAKEAGVACNHEADQSGCYKVCVRPPGWGDANQKALFNRLGNVNGKGDQEKVEKKA